MTYRILSLLALLTLAACSKPTPPDTDARPTRYSAAQFYETTAYVMAPYRAWSSDGENLLISSDSTGMFTVYALDAEGGDTQVLTQNSDSSQFPLSWFPDDGRMLYSADQGGNELTHIYVREVDGAVRDLTPGDKLKAEFLGWSHEGRHFYVLSNERDERNNDLYRYSAKDYAREMVFENTKAWMVSAVSPNGRFVALYRGNTFLDTDLYLYDLENPEDGVRHITPHDGDVYHQVYSFTPDSKSLVYGSDENNGFLEAWTYDLTTDSRTLRRQSNWDIDFLYFSDSGRYEVTGVNEDARLQLYIDDTHTRSPLTLPELPQGQISAVHFTPDDRQLAMMINTDTSPRDIYVVDLEASSVSRLTQAMSPSIDESELVDAQIIRYRSFDGLEIPSVLYRPWEASAENPVPALIWVHGGPGGQSRPGYSAMLQHLINHGYAILMPNNRGSSGYGKAFYRMDDLKHGTVDLDDIVYGRRYLAGLDWVDENRIGVMGGSYGGYIVGAALAFRDGEFQVGINIFGVMNWVRTLESIPPWWEHLRTSIYAEMGNPETDLERLLSVSPLAHAGNIKTPLLVAQGANDPRVLQVESDQIVAAVRANNVPVEYLIFEDEGHGFLKKANRISASEAYLRFLEEHL